MNLLTVCTRDGQMILSQPNSTGHSQTKKTFWNVQLADAGFYTCTAFIEITQQGMRKNFSLYVKAEPNPPRDLKVAAKSQKSIFITWKVPANPNPYLIRDPNLYIIRHKVLGSTRSRVEHNTTAPSLTIKGLNSDTVYEIRVSASNAQGRSVEVAVVTATPPDREGLVVTKSFLDQIRKQISVLDHEMKNLKTLMAEKNDE